MDGSADSAAAVGLGAWEAKRRRLPVLLVHGYLDQMSYATHGTPNQPFDTAVRNEARSMLTDVELRAHADHPGLTVRSVLVAGGGASTLVELSRTSSLVVVGARGSGGFAGLPLGSVGAQVAMYSHAAVIVVRRPADKPTDGVDDPAPGFGPVVVGVDGSAGSDAALEFAFDEASARGVPLVALHARWMLAPDKASSTSLLRSDRVEVWDEVERALAESLAGWSEKHPDVSVRPLVRHGMNPTWALIEASQEAGLVVVGSRGRGGFASLLLGSVSRALVGNAHCPVALIRERY